MFYKGYNHAGTASRERMGLGRRVWEGREGEGDKYGIRNRQGGHYSEGGCSPPKMRGAFSRRNSTHSALPAISLNSAPGSGERMRVAAGRDS